MNRNLYNPTYLNSINKEINFGYYKKMLNLWLN